MREISAPDSLLPAVLSHLGLPAAQEQVASLDSFTLAQAYHDKGDKYYVLERYEKALAAYERGIDLDPGFAFAHRGKGDALYALGRYEEALVAYELALLLDPNDVRASAGKDKVLRAFQSVREQAVAHTEEQKLSTDDKWQQAPESRRLSQDDLDKRIEYIQRKVIEGTSKAQLHIKRAVDKAGEYWQQTNKSLEPRRATSVEEERIRQLVNIWSVGNWQIARDLGTYMDLVSWIDDEVWEIRTRTHWETRIVETVAEPYIGQPVGKIEPLWPIWDYEFPAVVDLKAQESRIRLKGQDEVFSCTACNGTGRLLCAACTGRGWVVCPACKGRRRLRCSTCRGRGYIADWQGSEKKSFFQKQAENLMRPVNEKVSDLFEEIRQQSVPIDNSIDTDLTNKGRIVPCPDCVNLVGEVDCACGTGKRICSNCQGSKTELCLHCGGIGKVVHHHEIVRRFTFNTQSQFIGSTAIPEQRLKKASGDVVYNAEITEPLYADAASKGVPMDVWRTAVQLVQLASANPNSSPSNSLGPREEIRAGLQVLELVRIPYIKVDYRYADQDYVLYIYDVEGQEKFYADRYPARWDRVERLVRFITTDLMTPSQEAPRASSAEDPARGYRVPIEKRTYSDTEEE